VLGISPAIPRWRMRSPASSFAAIENIAEAPSRWPRLHGRFRRYLLHRFPFSVVYLEREHSIEVIAVAHHRRRPGYWKRR
jgi:hypothetical protein